MRHEPGHCMISGKPCFEIVARYANDHKLAGHILSLGQPLAKAWRLTLLLTNGFTATITIHEDHIENIDMNLLWNSILENEMHYYQHNESRDREAAHKSTIMNFSNNPPLSVVSMIRWAELQ